MADYLTLSPKNAFSFVCPVFDVETKLAACTTVRETVWMGKPVMNRDGKEVRIGCQAAMRCGMCPAAAIVKEISFGGGRISDDHGSVEPKKGKLHARILERIVNVSPVDMFLKPFNLSAGERDRLMTARSRIAEQLKTAPGAGNRKTAFIEPKRTAMTPVNPRKKAIPTEATETVPNAIAKAAMTGDMTAALNAA